MSVELEHKFVETNGIKLHLVESGPANGPLIILLHGFPEFWYGWHKQAAALVEAGYRLWIPDQRGYNLSDKPASTIAYRLDELAKDVVGLIEAAGQEKARLVGHDWGGAVAWWVASRYPQRVEQMVILNVPHPGAMVRQIRHAPRQLLKSWYVFFFQLPWLSEKLLSMNNWKPLEQSLNRSSRPGTFTPQDLQEYRAAWAQPGALRAMLNWYRATFRAALSGGIPDKMSVTVPTLILWGVKDVAVTPAAAQASLEMCEDGRLVYFEEASHWLQHEEPEQVNSLILDFFAGSARG